MITPTTSGQVLSRFVASQSSQGSKRGLGEDWTRTPELADAQTLGESLGSTPMASMAFTEQTLQELAAALKPMMREACVEAMDGRVTAVERRTSTLDKSTGTRGQDPESTEHRERQLPGWVHPELHHDQGVLHLERRKKGVSRAQAQSMVKDLKQRLLEDLREHIKEPNLRGMMSHAVRVDTTPTKTLEIRGCLQDIIRNDDINVNGIHRSGRKAHEGPAEVQEAGTAHGSHQEHSQEARGRS